MNKFDEIISNNDMIFVQVIKQNLNLLNFFGKTKICQNHLAFNEISPK